MLKECISSGMSLVSKESLPLYPLPRVHAGVTCSFLAFQRQCFNIEHGIFIGIAFSMSQLILY